MPRYRCTLKGDRVSPSLRRILSHPTRTVFRAAARLDSVRISIPIGIAVYHTHLLFLVSHSIRLLFLVRPLRGLEVCVGGGGRRVGVAAKLARGRRPAPTRRPPPPTQTSGVPPLERADRRQRDLAIGQRPPDTSAREPTKNQKQNPRLSVFSSAKRFII